MIVTINGIEIPILNDPAISIRCELEGDETIGPIEIRLSGGALTVQGSEKWASAMKVIHEDLEPAEPWLIFVGYEDAKLMPLR